ncbi:alpha-galactosidase [Nocardioides donggukensis]|uniref:alpha-galactosidase n=1 Tax=Nocardioides donggukensis TaxID=2774019 RepID=UPI00191C9FB4|nr:alpha-galactosidase [Nocardioides donggukensis]
MYLRANGVSLLLDPRSPGLPEVVHWGADLGDLSEETAAAVAAAAPYGVAHGALDARPPLELLPHPARGHLGRGGLVGSRAGRAWSPLFATTAVSRAEEGQAGAITVEAVDEQAALSLRSELRLTGQGVLVMRHTLVNDGDDPYDLVSLPVQLPVPARASELLDLTGRWGNERVPQRTTLNHGAWVREGRHGRTGHDAPLLLVAGTAGFGFRDGEAWAVHVAWSGDSTLWAERLPEGPTALGGGELLQAGEVRLGPGEAYSTPWVYAAHSARGLDGISHALHDLVRDRPQHPRAPRPVVLNTWEAVYFDLDPDRLLDMAEQAAQIGVERFVLDDGWFTGRTSDRAGLGDWSVSEAVLPSGLGPLIDRVVDLGMDFGLWVEPEMVNLDSDLARAHPDWLLAVPGRLPPEWRHQQVLDLAHPDAWEHILDRLDELLTEHRISYLKWDHNRDLIDAGHGEGPGVRAQTLAFYRMLDTLRSRHPSVEIESCASGGGRVDLEVLARTDRIWASDCTDALERQSIQRWTGLLVPPELVGAHVSAPRNHQTGRTLDLSFRAGTALFGHFGIEWDVTDATEAERAELAAWVAAYRELRPLLHSGDVVRADHLVDGTELHGVVARDRADALFAAVQTRTATASVPARVVLPGLDPSRTYRVRPQPPGDSPRTMERATPPWLAAGEAILPGSALARVGLPLPILAPEQLLLLRVTAVVGD